MIYIALAMIIFIIFKIPACFPKAQLLQIEKTLKTLPIIASTSSDAKLIENKPCSIYTVKKISRSLKNENKENEEKITSTLSTFLLNETEKYIKELASDKKYQKTNSISNSSIQSKNLNPFARDFKPDRRLFTNINT